MSLLFKKVKEAEALTREGQKGGGGGTCLTLWPSCQGVGAYSVGAYSRNTVYKNEYVKQTVLPKLITFRAIIVDL